MVSKTATGFNLGSRCKSPEMWYCWCKDSWCGQSIERVEKVGENEAGEIETGARIRSQMCDHGVKLII